MSVTLNPYLGFRDNAREAMDFYRSVLGGELTTTTFGEFDASDDPAESGKLMHAVLEAENGMTLMGADTPNRMPFQTGTNHSVSLSGDDEETLTRYWTGLSDGATVIEELTRAPWGDSFGMLTDRFGVVWLVNIAGRAS